MIVDAIHIGGGMIRAINETGRHTFSVRGNEIRSVTGRTLTVRDGLRIYTFDKRGRRILSLPVDSDDRSRR
jgi:hypothetical protein